MKKKTTTQKVKTTIKQAAKKAVRTVRHAAKAAAKKVSGKGTNSTGPKQRP